MGTDGVHQMSVFKLFSLLFVSTTLFAAGCGSSSVKGSASSASSGSFTSYAGPGYRFSFPVGWKEFSTHSTQSGATGTSLTAPDNSASIDSHAYPHSNTGVAETIREFAISEALTAQAGGIRNIHTQLRSVSVPGASEAKEVTQTFVNKAGRQRLAKLIVMTQAGTLIDLDASASQRSAGFDPQRVVDSFQLTGG